MIPQSLTLAAMQDAFREMETIIRPLRTDVFDLKGRRTVNAGKSIAPFDYVTQFELTEATKPITTARTGQSQIPVRVGPFATRGSAVNFAKTLFVASDHDYIGWISTGAVWRYAFGSRAVAQSGIAAVTAVLGINDVGYPIDVTDYLHRLVWNGTVLAFASHDSSGYVVASKGDGTAPTGGLWGLSDGTAYNVLQGDGTLTSTATQILSDSTIAAWYVRR